MPNTVPDSEDLKVSKTESYKIIRMITLGVHLGMWIQSFKSSPFGSEVAFVNVGICSSSE